MPPIVLRFQGRKEKGRNGNTERKTRTGEREKYEEATKNRSYRASERQRAKEKVRESNT